MSGRVRLSGIEGTIGSGWIVVVETSPSCTTKAELGSSARTLLWDGWNFQGESSQRPYPLLLTYCCPAQKCHCLALLCKWWQRGRAVRPDSVPWSSLSTWQSADHKWTKSKKPPVGPYSPTFPFFVMFFLFHILPSLSATFPYTWFHYARFWKVRVVLETAGFPHNTCFSSLVIELPGSS